MSAPRTRRNSYRRARDDGLTLHVRIVTATGEEGAAVRRVQVEAIREVLGWLQSQQRSGEVNIA